MAGRLLVLCPGQGAQHPAMFDMARGDPASSLLLDACFTDPVLAPLLEGVVDGASLFANRVAQPAIVAATLAMWEALRETVPARHCRGCCRRATAASPAVPLPNSAPWTGYALD